jgi:Dolichyl-phosphate-mannose-protein mannosyltransferase
MRRLDVAWLLAWMALSSAWCLTAARDLSATFDEPFYLRAGLNSWRTKSNYDLMRAGTMPLPVDVQYLPIFLLERVRGEPFDVDRDLHTILPYSRVLNLPFWWVLLVYGMLVGRLFGGPWAGRFAVVLIATEPSLLGHACLATTDISVTGFILAFAYHYQRGRDGGRWGRWILPGVLYGLAMMAKASALTFVPLVILSSEIPRLYAAGAFTPPPGVWRLKHLWRSTRQVRSDGWKILVIGTVVIWTYCGCDWKPQPSFVKLADNLPQDNAWASVVRWLAHDLTIFPNAGEAFAYQIKHNLRGHPCNTLGEWYPRSVWFHFPVLLTIKLTLMTLVLAAGLLIVRPRSLFSPIGLAALLLLLFSLNCRVQIGIRLVFPLVAVLLVALAVGLARATTNWSDRSRGGVLAVLTVACAYPAVTTWPDGIRYANELWGGTEKAAPLLADANYDWGQGLIDLDRWTAEHNLPTAKVWYYGMDPIIGKDPNRLLALHDPLVYPVAEPTDVWSHVRGKVVAVGYSLRYGYPGLTTSMPMVLEFFQGREPIGRSRTFLVYDFRKLP